MIKLNTILEEDRQGEGEEEGGREKEEAEEESSQECFLSREDGNDTGPATQHHKCQLHEEPIQRKWL